MHLGCWSTASAWIDNVYTLAIVSRNGAVFRDDEAEEGAGASKAVTDGQEKETDSTGMGAGGG